MIPVTKAAALRILSAFATRVDSVREMKNGAIQVSYRVGTRRCSTFLSRKAFERDFIEFRVQGAKGVVVREWGAGSYRGHYDAHSVDSDRHYTVRCWGLGVCCECEDYLYQHSQIGSEHAFCKHTLAVINERGFSSLPDCDKTWSQLAIATLTAFQ